MSYVNLQEIMIDIETLGVSKNSCILLIGAIKFSRNKPIPTNFSSIKQITDNLDTFYRKISISSCRKLGMEIEHPTLDWWKEQESEVFNEVFSKNDRIPIDQALKELTDWMTPSIHRFWARGPDFDYGILGNAFEKCELKTPWKFFHTRDVRTVIDICEIEVGDKIIGNAELNRFKHNPIVDCYLQILSVQEGYKKIMF